MRSKLDFIRDAIKIHEKTINEKKLPPKRKVASTQTQINNKTSFCFENPAVRENLEIPLLRQDIGRKVLKFDGEVSRGSRNPQVIPTDITIKGNAGISNKEGLQETIDFANYGNTFQREIDTNEEELVEKKRRPEVSSEKTEVIKHFIMQAKYILSKARDVNIKTRLQRLLDYLYSGNNNVKKLGISQKNFVTEGSFDSGVTFNAYLNYIARPDNDRITIPNFYQELFGEYVEQPQEVQKAKSTEKVKPFRPLPYPNDFFFSLDTTRLRQIKPESTDSPQRNTKWMYSICKYIETIEDVFTLVSSIGYCLDGTTTDIEKLYKQKKAFVDTLQETLETEYGI